MTAETEVDVDVDGEGEAQPKKRWLSRGRLVIVGAAVAGLLLAIGVAAYFLIFAGSQTTRETPVVASETFIFNLPPMTVNLSGGGQGEQFMKLSIALEVQSEDVMLQIQPRMARVLDAFQVYLRELRKSDLEGSAGIYRLKEELLRRVNVAIFPAQVENILFREILIQ